MMRDTATNHRPTIERLRLIAFLLRSNKNFTAGELAKTWECTRKTIVRDLDFLGRLGYEFEYDRRARRYRLDRAPAPAL